MTVNEQLISQALCNIGLSDKEVKTYLVLLALKEAQPSLISQESGVKRPTTYVVLDALQRQGLVSKVKKQGVYYYQPVAPNSLLQREQRRLHDLKSVLPDLELIHGSSTAQPHVSFFQGVNGLIEVMEDTLTASTELLCWADIPMDNNQALNDYFPRYISKRIQKNIWLRGIFPYDQDSLRYKKNGRKELRESYLIPKEDYPLQNEINIYDDKVAIISHKDSVGVIIKNQHIADSQRSIFRFAFKYAKIAEANLLTQADLEYLNS